MSSMFRLYDLPVELRLDILHETIKLLEPRTRHLIRAAAERHFGSSAIHDIMKKVDVPIKSFRRHWPVHNEFLRPSSDTFSNTILSLPIASSQNDRGADINDLSKCYIWYIHVNYALKSEFGQDVIHERPELHEAFYAMENDVTSCYQYNEEKEEWLCKIRQVHESQGHTSPF